jgi:ketosteroid isomerase-like protein
MEQAKAQHMKLQDELQAALDEMARVYVEGDVVACAALFTANATLHSPYAPPARGRAEIEARHRVWTEGATAKRFEILDHGGSGDVAWALARFSEGEVTWEGTTLAVFERSVDAGWLVRACSLNSLTE